MVTPSIKIKLIMMMGFSMEQISKTNLRATACTNPSILLAASFIGLVRIASPAAGSDRNAILDSHADSPAKRNISDVVEKAISQQLSAFQPNEVNVEYYQPTNTSDIIAHYKVTCKKILPHVFFIF